jgi:hypothetical protein
VRRRGSDAAIAERWFFPDAEKERHAERRPAAFPAEEYV